MSLGSFVQGAFQGYTFGEKAKDVKKERARNEERFEWERGDQEWLGESRDRKREDWKYTDTVRQRDSETWARDDQWLDETRDRKREDWDYTDTVRDRQRDQWTREDQQQAEQEAAQDELERIRTEGFEEWRRGQNVQPAPQNTPQGSVFVPLDPSRNTGEPVPSSPQATFPGLSVPGLSQPNPNAAPFRYGDDVPRMENRPIRVPLGSAGDDTLSGNMGGDMLLTDIQPVRGTYSEQEQENAPQVQERSTQPEAGSVREVDPNRSAFIQDIQSLMRQGDISSAQNRIAQGLATGKYGPAGSPAARAFGALGDYFTATPTEGQENAAARRKTAEAIEWYRSDAARALFEQNPDMLTAAAADPIGFLEQQAGTGPAQGQPQGEPQLSQGTASAAEPPAQPEGAQPAAPQSQGSGAGQPVYGGMTASQAAQFQDLPEPRMALEDGGQPISIARDSLASNANADNNGQAPQVTDQQRAAATDNFAEYYKTVVRPREIEALYRAGDIEGARRLEEWLDDDRSQYLQENYTKAVAAAGLGDERGFFDHLGKVYNSYDDGYRLIADESDLYKNEAGETIAKITLENTQTGERFTQEYEGGEELMQQVLTQLDPVNIFKTLQGQAEAEADAAAKQQAWEIGEARRRIEDGFETPSDRRQVFFDAWEKLSTSSPNWLSMSPEEKVIAVEDFLAQADNFATGGTAQPEAPVYLGD